MVPVKVILPEPNGPAVGGSTAYTEAPPASYRRRRGEILFYYANVYVLWVNEIILQAESKSEEVLMKRSRKIRMNNKRRVGKQKHLNFPSKNIDFS